MTEAINIDEQRERPGDAGSTQDLFIVPKQNPNVVSPWQSEDDG